MKNCILQIDKITKSFGLTRALADVSFSIGKGEIRGFIGENGSGKSTLSNIIAGVYQSDSGQLILDGESYSPRNIVEAEAKQVSLIVQEIGTVDKISVAANLFLGNEKKFSKGGALQLRKMEAEAKRALHDIGIDNIDPAQVTGKLNLEERKILEIAKAYYVRPKLMIVDETSNALSTYGRSILYNVIKKVKSEGGTVLFITHDLDELIEVCDSVTILRDGIYIDTLYGEQMDIHELKTKMVGRDIDEHYYRTDWDRGSTGETVLQVQNVFTSLLKDVTFDLHAGEILGLGGLSDCGMHELGRLLFGLERPFSGRITCKGKKITTPKQAIQNGIGYISKNRDTEAIILKSSIRDNVCLCSLDQISHGGFAFPTTENRFADNWIEKLNIKLNNRNQYVAELSGGNKQKVVLAKWLGRGSKTLIMDCPTRGIDIGVKEAIYKLMSELRNEGHAILLISEELPELIGMSDNIMIMKNGEVVKRCVCSPEITESVLIHDMI